MRRMLRNEGLAEPVSLRSVEKESSWLGVRRMLRNEGLAELVPHYVA